MHIWKHICRRDRKESYDHLTLIDHVVHYCILSNQLINKQEMSLYLVIYLFIWVNGKSILYYLLFVQWRIISVHWRNKVCMILNMYHNLFCRVNISSPLSYLNLRGIVYPYNCKGDRFLKWDYENLRELMLHKCPCKHVEFLKA